MIVDDHAHLFLYNDVNKIIENIEKGVYAIIENGLDIETNRKVIEESNKFDFVYFALGFHPNYLENLEDHIIEKELEFIENFKNEKFLAIGEIGLDYYHTSEIEKIKKQRKYFEKLLEIADKKGLPVIIHSRNSEEDVLSILESYNNKKVLHSFWKPKLVKKAIDIGCFISIPAFVYKDKGLQKIAEETPLDLILTETDAPFLDPIGYRENNSWKILYGIQKISEIKKTSIEDIEKHIKNNFKKVYNI